MKFNPYQNCRMNPHAFCVPCEALDYFLRYFGFPKFASCFHAWLQTVQCSGLTWKISLTQTSPEICLFSRDSMLQPGICFGNYRKSLMGPLICFCGYTCDSCDLGVSHILPSEGSRRMTLAGWRHLGNAATWGMGSLPALEVQCL